MTEMISQLKANLKKYIFRFKRQESVVVGYQTVPQSGTSNTKSANCLL